MAQPSPQDLQALAEIQSCLEKIRGGDSSAYRRLLELTQPRLGRFCFYLTHSREIAEELCQDCMIAIFESMDTLREPKKYWSWLFTIAKNRFLNYAKKKSTVSETPTEDLEQVLGAGLEAADQETLHAIRRVFADLTPEDRMLLLLVHVEGYSYREVFEITGVSEELLRSRALSARRRFLKKFEAD